MADEKDYSEFYGKDYPFIGREETLGKNSKVAEFIKYLESKPLDKLNNEEQKCYESYLRYLEAKKSKGEDLGEEEYKFEEGAIDWHRLDSFQGVAFYICFPKYMLSERNKNTQNFVMNKWLGKSGDSLSMGEIVEYAKKQIEIREGKTAKPEDKKTVEQKTEEEPAEKIEEKKPVEDEEKPSKEFKEARDESLKNFEVKGVLLGENDSEKGKEGELEVKGVLVGEKSDKNKDSTKAGNTTVAELE